MEVKPLEYPEINYQLQSIGIKFTPPRLGIRYLFGGEENLDYIDIASFNIDPIDLREENPILCNVTSAQLEKLLGMLNEFHLGGDNGHASSPLPSPHVTTSPPSPDASPSKNLTTLQDLPSLNTNMAPQPTSQLTLSDEDEVEEEYDFEMEDEGDGSGEEDNFWT